MPSETRQLGLPPARASLPSPLRNVGMLIYPPLPPRKEISFAFSQVVF